ncbi:MAG: ribonuclease D [Nitrospiraceae bacterium]
MPHRHLPHYISDEQALSRLCDALESCTRLGIDTEFIGEDSFVPRLELIQLSTTDLQVVLDFPALQQCEALPRLCEILCSTKIEKIVHAGRQDLELLATYVGQLPRPFFDTQIAASMLGFGAQIAYAQLVQRTQGAKLEKSHTFTNWSQRPLSHEQIAYALADVRYLLPIHDELLRRLQSLGRLEWVQEEFDRLGTLVVEREQTSRERYQRIRGWDSLKPRQAAVLRELTAWRETEARRRNVPRGRVLRDEVLLQVARQAPKHQAELREIRGFPPQEVARSSEAILAIIAHALTLPASEWPEVPRDRKPDPESAGQIELLQAALKARAAALGIAPTLLATAGDLQKIVEERATGATPTVPLLEGWRRAIAGDMILSVLEGRTALRISSESGQVMIYRDEDRSA